MNAGGVKQIAINSRRKQHDYFTRMDFAGTNYMGVSYIVVQAS